MRIKVECTLCLQGPEGVIPNVDCQVHGFSRVRSLLMGFCEEDSPCECLTKDAREAVGFDA